MSMSLAATAVGRTIGSLIGPFVWNRAGVVGNCAVAALMVVLAVVVLARWLREGTQEKEG
jgi:predicted MFS family arabinose efflux permease